MACVARGRPSAARIRPAPPDQTGVPAQQGATDFGAMPVKERNIADWQFLSLVGRIWYPQWEEVAARPASGTRWDAVSMPVKSPDASFDKVIGLYKIIRLYSVPDSVGMRAFR
jgi:hypothetical protein